MEGFFPSVDIFLALVMALSDWFRAGREELSNCGCLGPWRPSDSRIMETSGFQNLEDGTFGAGTKGLAALHFPRPAPRKLSGSYGHILFTTGG